MEITDIRVRKIDREGKLKAVVSVTIDNEIAIHDIKIIEGEKGCFISMPSRKTQDGTYIDIVHPINTDARHRLQELILEKYKQSGTGESVEG